MKKLIIFFIVMVLITTFALTRSNKSIQGRELTQQELEEYRNSIKNTFEKHNLSYTESDLENQVNNYKSKIAKGKTIKGMSFVEAFPHALRISAIVCGIVALIFLIKGSYYNELLNSNIWIQGNKMSREGRIEINNVKAKNNFWGRWFR